LLSKGSDEVERCVKFESNRKLLKRPFPNKKKAISPKGIKATKKLAKIIMA
jgi:hypothetical protein